MKKLFTLIFVISSFSIFGNINHIKFDKISQYNAHAEKFSFLTENQNYFNHWEPNWTYDVSKISFIKKLKECYYVFSKLENKNIETYLLLGDISHYLYNLHEDKYYELAVNFYENAIKSSPKDFRPFWFLANHYALSNVQDKSIEYFIKSRKKLPKNEPAEFWEDFSLATATANMPSHCIYAMDKARLILGEKSDFEKHIGKSINDMIIPVKSDSIYKFTNIWSASEGDLASFVSRPLGLKLLIDPIWKINFYDYENNQSLVTIIPPAIRNRNGKPITYTIAISMRVAKKGETLNNFISNYVSRYTDKNEFSFSNKYPNLMSFELKDKQMYKDMGGAHMHMIGIKRMSPKYCGLLLEQPMIIPQGNSKKETFYRASDSKDRFDGEIYYAIMLDACEDIYEEAYALFKEIFEKQIIIE